MADKHQEYADLDLYSSRTAHTGHHRGPADLLDHWAAEWDYVPCMAVSTHEAAHAGTLRAQPVVRVVIHDVDESFQARLLSLCSP